MDHGSAILSVLGIPIAFNGAVDTWVVIEKLFRNDSGLADRVLNFE